MTSGQYAMPGGYAVTFALEGPVLSCEWEPAVPQRDEFWSMLLVYRAARDSFVAAIVDGPVVMIESLSGAAGHA